MNWIILVDGRPMRKLPLEHEGLIEGDTKSLSIAMASLLAVTRDRFMRDLRIQFPDFGFDSNKGYGAPVHLKALEKYGPTGHHRPFSFVICFPGIRTNRHYRRRNKPN